MGADPQNCCSISYKVALWKDQHPISHPRLLACQPASAAALLDGERCETAFLVDYFLARLFLTAPCPLFSARENPHPGSMQLNIIRKDPMKILNC